MLFISWIIIYCVLFLGTMASVGAELVAERQSEAIMEIEPSNKTFVGAEGLVRMAFEQYTEILETASDPRVSDWPLMDSPVPSILIVALYLYFVTQFGPKIMINKKPFRLRNILVAYNAFQVIFSMGMLYEVINLFIIILFLIIFFIYFKIILRGKIYIFV